jgi:hypothetical protein
MWGLAEYYTKPCDLKLIVNSSRNTIWNIAK